MGVKKEEEPDKSVTEDGKVDYRWVVVASSRCAPKVVDASDSSLLFDPFLQVSVC